MLNCGNEKKYLIKNKKEQKYNIKEMLQTEIKSIHIFCFSKNTTDFTNFANTDILNKLKLLMKNIDPCKSTINIFIAFWQSK